MWSTTTWRAATPWCWRWRRRSAAPATSSSIRPPSIIGSVIAPDKGLATLPITCTVIGMWLGTLPVGMLARRFGRRVAVQTGAVLRRALRPHLLLRGDERQFLAAAGRHLLRRALFGLAAELPLRRHRHRERAIPPQGGVLGAGRRRVRGVLGPQIVIFTKDMLHALHCSPPAFSARRRLRLLALLVLAW